MENNEDNSIKNIANVVEMLKQKPELVDSLNIDDIELIQNYLDDYKEFLKKEKSKK